MSPEKSKKKKAQVSPPEESWPPFADDNHGPLRPATDCYYTLKKKKFKKEKGGNQRRGLEDPPSVRPGEKSCCPPRLPQTKSCKSQHRYKEKTKKRIRHKRPLPQTDFLRSWIFFYPASPGNAGTLQCVISRNRFPRRGQAEAAPHLCACPQQSALARDRG